VCFSIHRQAFVRYLILALLATSIFLGCATASATDIVPSYIGKHISTAQDTRAIKKIIEDFQTAIKTKDRKLLSTLVLNSNILFDSPMSPEDIAYVRDNHDTTFDGLRAGGYGEFARVIGMSKESIEEKFYNVKITQDGNVAWVMFDYEFVRGGKTQNYGIETWQMMKVDSNNWKIASVMWTMNRP
jgi:ketosteroid isomerase-like protein